MYYASLHLYVVTYVDDIIFIDQLFDALGRSIYIAALSSHYSFFLCIFLLSYQSS